MIVVIHPGSGRLVAYFDAATIDDAPIQDGESRVKIGDRRFDGRTLADFQVRDDLSYDGDRDPSELIVQDGAVIVAPAVLAREQERAAAARDAAAKARHRRVDALRDSKLAQGMTYTMPDGAGVWVPLDDRPYLDNLRALVTQAAALVAAGDQTTTINLGHATDDGEHDLTGPEMMAFGEAILGHIQAHYKAARAHRRELTRIATETPGPMKDVIAALDAYDITAGWPA